LGLGAGFIKLQPKSNRPDSGVKSTRKPVIAKNQEEHHRKTNFEEEFPAVLEKHPIAFDER